jgi:NTP pyrophosphatase (non-canonical NTP hydrolase)
MRDADTPIAALRACVAAFVAARRWDIHHRPRNLAMSIAIEAAELMEHFQWQDPTVAELDPTTRDEIAAEVADVVIYTLSFCNALQIDLSAAVAAKLAVNETRFPPTRGEAPTSLGSASQPTQHRE